MSIRAPGEECLTQTQIAQREVLTLIRDKQSAAQAAPIKPIETSEKTSTGYGSPHSKLLDITV